MTVTPDKSATPDSAHGKLTTHVLDTANGKPGAAMAISLYRLQGVKRDEVLKREMLLSTITNSDGRCDAPLLDGERFSAGTYELEFAVGDYFRSQGNDPAPASPRFLETVVIRFGINSPAEHYHVPLLVSPFAYSTYRGS